MSMSCQHNIEIGLGRGRETKGVGRKIAVLKIAFFLGNFLFPIFSTPLCAAFLPHMVLNEKNLHNCDTFILNNSNYWFYVGSKRNKQK